MFDALSFTEVDGQHVELLPARTVMSLFSSGKGGGGCTAKNGDVTTSGLVDVTALNNINLLNNFSLIPIGILGKGQC